MKKMRLGITLKLVTWTLGLGFFCTATLTYYSMQQISNSVRLSEESALLSEQMRFNESVVKLIDQVNSFAQTIEAMKRVKPDLLDRISNQFGVTGQNWQVVRTYQILNGRPRLQNSMIRDANGLDKIRADRDWDTKLSEAKIDFLKLTNGESTIQKISEKEGWIVFGSPLKRSAKGLISHVSIVVLSERGLAEMTADDSNKTQGLIDLEKKSVVFNTSKLEFSDLQSLFEQIRATSGMTQKFGAQIKDSKYLIVATHLGASNWSFSALPEAVMTVPVREALRWSLALGLAILAIAISVTVAFALRFTKPVEVLTQLTSKIGKGDFNVNAASQIKTGDEIEYLANSLDQMTTGLKEREKVKNLFQKFHGSEITEDLMKRELALGGQSKEIVVFFSDIRGFTTLSERLSPDVLVSILNRYFSRMVRVILESGGLVDKFVGDAIMAFWGHDVMNDDVTRAAYNACLKMRVELDALNRELENEGLPTLTIGMGLHRGKAIVGTIGSEDRMEFTSIGDTINTAARVESLTKEYKTDLLITEPIYKCVASGNMEQLGEVILKGKNQPVKIFGRPQGHV